jgi:copper resistance protein B
MRAASATLAGALLFGVTLPARAQTADDTHTGHHMPAAPAAEELPPPRNIIETAVPQSTGSTPQANYADRVWGREAMIRSREALRREHGGGTFSQVMFDLAEYQFRDGRDGYRWDGEAWFGGDINRLVVKSEGEGTLGESIDDAEVQLLYSRAVGPYFNLQAGVRHDFRPSPSRTHATIGFEGLAPYWFEVAGALFLSDRGDVTARLEGYYDQRLTQRLIAQPRVELNFAAQDVRDAGIGSGFSDLELGFRLRYEFKREFAPYVGITYDRKIGDTARLATLAGEEVGATGLVVGIRAWF